MENLNYYLQKAKEGGYALGHFNFASAEQLKAIVQAFQKIVEESGKSDLALMVGTSEGEAGFLGYDQSVGLVEAWRKQTSLPIFLNADHHKSFESCKKAIDAGYDTVLIDASKLPFKENVELTEKVMGYGKSKNPHLRQGFGGQAEITFEGELGYLKGSSEIQGRVEINSEDFTSPEEASEFVKQTGVDRLAVVFGNIHGIVTEQEERLEINHFKKIVTAVPDVYFVLHGASGLKDEDVKEAIKAGITNVHINTEIRVAFHQAIEDFEKSPQPHTTTPYKIMAPTVEAMQKVAEDKLRLFTNT